MDLEWKSEKIDKLSLAIVAFQQEVKGAKLNSANPFFNSKYSDLNAVWTAAQEANLSAHGLGVLHFPCETSKGEPGLRTVVVHTSGEWMSEIMPLCLKSDDPQGQGSGITYARRYAFCSALGIYQEDDDGESAQKAAAFTRQDAAGNIVKKDGEPILPKCPKCGKNNLRNSKTIPGTVYCWVKKEGCGYDSSKDETPTEDEDTIPF